MIFRPSLTPPNSYSSLVAVKLATFRWLQEVSDNGNIEEAVQLTGAAYLFNDAAFFKLFTHRLIYKHHSTVDLLQLEFLPESIPILVFSTISRRFN